MFKVQSSKFIASLTVPATSFPSRQGILDFRQTLALFGQFLYRQGTTAKGFFQLFLLIGFSFPGSAVHIHASPYSSSYACSQSWHHAWSVPAPSLAAVLLLPAFLAVACSFFCFILLLQPAPVSILGIVAREILNFAFALEHQEMIYHLVHEVTVVTHHDYATGEILQTLPTPARFGYRGHW